MSSTQSSIKVVATAALVADAARGLGPNGEWIERHAIVPWAEIYALRDALNEAGIEWNTAP